MLCCFIKQKTAYEMRTSDWSSDVCSSDLRRTHAPHNLHHAPKRGALELLASVQRVTVLEQAYVVLGDDVDGVARGRDRAQRHLVVVPVVQIGRASCRERVCLSV